MLLLSVSLVAGCGGHVAPNARQRIIESDIDIRCAALEAAAQRYVRRQPTQPLALADSIEITIPPAVVVRRALQAIADLDSTTVHDYFAQNAVRQPSCSELPSGAPLVLVADSVRRSLPRGLELYWPAFYAAFPGSTGLTRVSGVGLSTNRRQAMLVISHGCGALCGHQVLDVLTRDDTGTWRIHYSSVMVVS